MKDQNQSCNAKSKQKQKIGIILGLWNINSFKFTQMMNNIIGDLGKSIANDFCYR